MTTLFKLCSVICLLSLFAIGSPTAMAEFSSSEQSLSVSQANIELIGHLGGQNHALVVGGDYVYMGQGPEFTILDAYDLTRPTRIGGLMLPDMAHSIALHENYAYVAAGSSGLYIINIANFAKPTLVSSLQTAAPVYQIAWHNDHIYLASQALIEMVNVEEPTAPFSVSTIESISQINEIEAVNDRLYVAADGLFIIDIEHPTHPLLLNRYALEESVQKVEVWGQEAVIVTSSGDIQLINLATLSLVSSINAWVYDIAVDDHYLYATTFGELRLFDLSDLANPLYAGSYYTMQPLNEVIKANGVLYLRHEDGSLEIIDVSNASAPQRLGIYETFYDASQLALANNQLYISANGLRQIDLSDLSNPKLSLRYDLFWGYEWIEDFVITDHYVYYAGNTDYPAGWLGVLDRRSPSALTQIGGVGLSSFVHDVVISGNYAYVTADNGLRVIDITTPTQPVEIGAYYLPLEDSISHIVLSDQYAYLTTNDELRIIDITTPATPSEIGRYLVPDGDASTINELLIEGNYAYLAERVTYYKQSQGRFSIIDLSNPAHPVAVSQYEAAGEATTLLLQDNYAYLGWSDGLRLIDISQPSQATLVGTYQQNNRVTQMILEQNQEYNQLYLGSANGLSQLDVSNPANPTLSASYDSPLGVRDLIVADHTIFMLNEGGLFILNANPEPTSHEIFLPVIER